MTSVDRLIDYIDIVPEAPLTSKKDVKPSADWPTDGNIVSRGVNMKYAPEAPLALNNITFNIKAREKVLLAYSRIHHSSTCSHTICASCTYHGCMFSSTILLRNIVMTFKCITCLFIYIFNFFNFLRSSNSNLNYSNLYIYIIYNHYMLNVYNLPSV